MTTDEHIQEGVRHVKHRTCCRCGVTKPLNAENFPLKASNRSMYRGICIKCWNKEHPNKEHPEEEVKAFHPARLYFMCTKKQTFKSEQAAKNVAIKHALKHRGQKVQTYQCPACHKWHLTTHPR